LITPAKASKEIKSPRMKHARILKFVFFDNITTVV
jgi:hypothetical protein